MSRRVLPTSLAAIAVAGLFLTQAVAGAEEGPSATRTEATTARDDSNRSQEAKMAEHCQAMMKDMAAMRETQEEMHAQMGDMARMHEAAKAHMQEMHREMMDGMGQMRDDMARMHPQS